METVPPDIDAAEFPFRFRLRIPTPADPPDTVTSALFKDTGALLVPREVVASTSMLPLPLTFPFISANAPEVLSSARFLPRRFFILSSALETAVSRPAFFSRSV